MATHTYTEQEVVDRERKVVECDYCHLMTSEDLREDEEMQQILLNPTIVGKNSHWTHEWMVDDILNAENEAQASRILHSIVSKFSMVEEDAADLCPSCVDSLFGEGPATGIRSGTGYIKP